MAKAPTERDFHAAWETVLRAYSKPGFRSNPRVRTVLEFLGMDFDAAEDFISEGLSTADVVEMVMEQFAIKRERGRAVRAGFQRLRDAEENALERKLAREKSEALEAKRRQLVAEKRVEANSLVLSNQEMDALAKMSFRAIDERVRAKSLKRAEETAERAKASAFWRAARKMSKSGNEVLNLVVIREGGKSGKPIGYITYGMTRTTKGINVIHLTDAFIEPQYRVGTGEYSLLNIAPNLVIGAINVFRKDKSTPYSRSLSYFTYDSALRPRKSGGQLKVQILYPPAFRANEPEPEGKRTVNAIRLKPQDKILPSTWTPFALKPAGEKTQSATLPSRARRRSDGKPKPPRRWR